MSNLSRAGRLGWVVGLTSGPASLPSLDNLPRGWNHSRYEYARAEVV